MKNEGDVTEHLEELRRKILSVLLFFLVAFVVLFVFSERLFAFLQGPLEGLGLSLYYFKPYEKFMTYMRISFWGGTILSLPLAILQASLFVYPALRKNEIRYFLFTVLAAPLFFVAGSAFAYRVIAPMAFRFFLSFSPKDNVLPFWGFGEYASFLFTLMVASGLVFLLPLLILFLIGTGLVSTRSMSRLRPWIIMAIAFAAALLTPPDVVSQILLGLPLYLLFEGSLLAGRWLEK
ncbi:MAG: twin-arginine translocase subunit TatC [Synergistales bacterium]